MQVSVARFLCPFFVDVLAYMWAVGCLFAEILIREPLFAGPDVLARINSSLSNESAHNRYKREGKGENTVVTNME